MPTSKPKSIESLSFSVYTRYKALAETVEALRSKAPFKILEVGGRGNFLQQFLPKDSVTILDVIDSNEPNYVKGDGRNLPFGEHEFDIVLSTDVLEHIRPENRKEFIQEQIRVAKKAIIISGPVWNEKVVTIEKEVNEYYKSSTKTDHPWLGEHISYGLSKLSTIEGILKENNLNFSLRYNQDLSLWKELVMLDMDVSMAATPDVLSTFDELSRVYNTQIYKFDRGEKGYRAILTVMTDGKQPPKVTQVKDISQLPPDQLIRLMSSATKMLRSIKDYYFLALTDAQKDVVEKTIETQKKTREYENHISSLETVNSLLASRLARIEASWPYKVWRNLKRLFNKTD